MAAMSTLRRPWKLDPPAQSAKPLCNKQQQAQKQAFRTKATRRAQAQARLDARLGARLGAGAEAEAEAPGQELACIFEIVSRCPLLTVDINGNYYMLDPSLEALAGSTAFEKLVNSLIQVGTLPLDASRYPTIPIRDEDSIEKFARGPDLRKMLEQEFQMEGVLLDLLLTKHPATATLAAYRGENALQIYIHSAFNQLSHSRRCHIHKPQTLARRLASINRDEESRMPTPPQSPSPKEGLFDLVQDSVQTSYALQRPDALPPALSQTSGSMQGPDKASFIPSKFLEFNADVVVVFTFDEKVPGKQTNTWERLNWKKFTKEQRNQTLMMYLSTCTECWHTKHFNSVIAEAKALSFESSVEEAIDYKEIMDNLHAIARDPEDAAQQEEHRILTWFLHIWEELEAKHLHELSTIYATVEDEFCLSQDFRRILADKARMLRETNVFRQLSLEDVVFLLFIIKIRRIRVLEIGKALAEERVAEKEPTKEIWIEAIMKRMMTGERTELEMEEYALGKEGEAKKMPKVSEKREAKDLKRKIREAYARGKAIEVASEAMKVHSKAEFIDYEVRLESESERVRLKRDFVIMLDLHEGGYGTLGSWVTTRDFVIGDLLYEVYQHVKAILQSHIHESHPGLQAKSLQKQGESAVDMNDDEKLQASGVQYPQEKNSQAKGRNVDPDSDKDHGGTKAQVEKWNMDPNVAEEFERIIFQPFFNTREYILGLVKKADLAE